MGYELLTTKAQVTGYRFLRRRVHHGLVLGDIRMIHDPIARRSKAVAMSTVAAAIGVAGSGAVAVFAPDPQPGDNQIVRSPAGHYYARIDQQYHLTQNLSSAKLIAGAQATVGKIGNTALRNLPRGVPVGIPGAPDRLDKVAASAEFAVCHTAAGTELPQVNQGDDVAPWRRVLNAVRLPRLREHSLAGAGAVDSGAVVDAGMGSGGDAAARGGQSAGGKDAAVAGFRRRALDGAGAFGVLQRDVQVAAERVIVTMDPVTVPLGEDEALLAVVDGRWWLVRDGSRVLLPPENSPLGVALRELLGVSADTPVWRPPAAVLNTIPERAPFGFDPQGVVLRAGHAKYFVVGEKHQRLTVFQAELLDAAGVPTVTVVRSQPITPIEDPSLVVLPEHRLQVVSPAQSDVCVTGRGASVGRRVPVVDAGVELPGSSVATHFQAGFPEGIVVDTTTGYFVIGQTGARYMVADRATVEVLDPPSILQGPWPIIRLLPQGQPFSREAALRPAEGFYQLAP
ncbi:ESX-1 secretion system protein eccB1 [Corynebacterium choanae]|uniref:ESX-1 secretion system protein eccB1 n=1 Tax=Corynebacterium choanae TaxID=1862358 RepID=A0A3G6J8P7_9CORY|nr:ESX-1 secretion system protein eccB1 [Corynebacterium choanae]